MTGTTPALAPNADIAASRRAFAVGWFLAAAGELTVIGALVSWLRYTPPSGSELVTTGIDRGLDAYVLIGAGTVVALLGAIVAAHGELAPRLRLAVVLLGALVLASSAYEYVSVTNDIARITVERALNSVGVGIYLLAAGGAATALGAALVPTAGHRGSPSLPDRSLSSKRTWVWLLPWLTAAAGQVILVSAFLAWETLVVERTPRLVVLAFAGTKVGWEGYATAALGLVLAAAGAWVATGPRPRWILVVAIAASLLSLAVAVYGYLTISADIQRVDFLSRPNLSLGVGLYLAGIAAVVGLATSLRLGVPWRSPGPAGVQGSP